MADGSTIAVPAADDGFDLARALEAIRCGGPVSVPGINYVRAVIHGETVHFAVSDRKDPIQKQHRRGRFYEEEELSLIRRAFPVGGVMVDIGANIGNHALYAARFLHAERVIAIEPNPEACRYLVANVLMNGLEARIDLSRIGLGLSDETAEGLSLAVPRGNLGAARLREGGGGVRVVKGDDLLADIAPDLIKIDVEGMEMRVLSGLEETIARHRPRMFVEVDNANVTDFREWAEAWGYKFEATYRRYEANENYLLAPRRRWRRPGERGEG